MRQFLKELDDFNYPILLHPVESWFAAPGVNRNGLPLPHGSYVHRMVVASACQSADGHEGTSEDDQAQYRRHEQFEQEKQSHYAHERGKEKWETSHDLDFYEMKKTG